MRDNVPVNRGVVALKRRLKATVNTPDPWLIIDASVLVALHITTKATCEAPREAPL
jgi:hypothetical protein